MHASGASREIEEGAVLGPQPFTADHLWGRCVPSFKPYDIDQATGYISNKRVEWSLIAYRLSYIFVFLTSPSCCAYESGAYPL